MRLYEKNTRCMRGNFFSYCDNNGVTYIQIPIFGFDFDQNELELWGKFSFLYTATENCFQVDRLELNASLYLPPVHH